MSVPQLPYIAYEFNINGLPIYDGGNGGYGIIVLSDGVWVFRDSDGIEQLLVATLNLVPDASLPTTGTITPDALDGNKKSITQTGNLTFNAPLNPADMRTVIFRLTMGGAGSYTRTWNAAYVFGGDLASSVASTSVGSIDEIGFEYHAANAKWYCFSYVRIN